MKQHSPSPSGLEETATGRAHTASSGVVPSVQIIPERPTAENDLEVILSGVNGGVTLRWERNGKTIEGAQSARLARGQFNRDDEIAVIARADEKEVGTSVKIANSPPRIKSVTLSTSAVIYSGSDITAIPEGSDSDGDELSFEYQWLINHKEVEMSNSAVLPGAKFKRNDLVSVRVTPFDGLDRGRTFDMRPLKVQNAPPRFTTTPPSSWNTQVYVYNALAEDPDGDVVIYSLLKAPTGMTIDSKTGRVEWKLTKDTTGKHEVELEAKDALGGQAIQRHTMTFENPNMAGNKK